MGGEEASKGTGLSGRKWVSEGGARIDRSRGGSRVEAVGPSLLPSGEELIVGERVGNDAVSEAIDDCVRAGGGVTGAERGGGGGGNAAACARERGEGRGGGLSRKISPARGDELLFHSGIGWSAAMEGKQGRSSKKPGQGRAASQSPRLTAGTGDL